jgi:hypothetical protein
MPGFGDMFGNVMRQITGRGQGLRKKGQPAAPAAMPQKQAPMMPGVKDPSMRFQQPLPGGEQRQPAPPSMGQLATGADTANQTANQMSQIDPATGLPRVKKPMMPGAQQANTLGMLAKAGGLFGRMFQ